MPTPRSIPSAALAAILSALVLPPAVQAQPPSPGRFTAIVEAGAIWSQRNVVRIPPDTGTRFSIVDLIGRATTPLVRVELTAALAERHELRFVFAPIAISGDGIPASAIAFAGGRFAPGTATGADYQFSSYRGTYRYRFYDGGRWQWQVGVTGFVRDARIALSQPGVDAEDTDVGFVPLGHLRGRGALTDRVGLTIDVDATAAPQGRAFDVAAMIDVAVGPRWTVGGGYRTVEGGADVDTVYNFAWLNAVVARLGYKF